MLTAKLLEVLKNSKKIVYLCLIFKAVHDSFLILFFLCPHFLQRSQFFLQLFTRLLSLLRDQLKLFDLVGEANGNLQLTIWNAEWDKKVCNILIYYFCYNFLMINNAA